MPEVFLFRKESWDISHLVIPSNLSISYGRKSALYVGPKILELILPLVGKMNPIGGFFVFTF